MNLEDLLGHMKPNWHRDAACREHPDVNFFPGLNVSSAPAKAICNGCLVRHECLDDAMATGERYGIRGGLTARQRSLKARGLATEPTLNRGERVGRRGPIPLGCGTRAGAAWHRTHGEQVCADCAIAAAQYARDYRARRRADGRHHPSGGLTRWASTG